jgi:hypothetical protein
VIHIGKDNLRHKYYMKGTLLGTTEEEKYIGVYINPTLKPREHCRKAANKTMGVLKKITKCFYYRDKNTFLKLYK